MNKTKLLQMAALLAVIVVLAGGFLRALQRDSMTLTENERLQAAEDRSEVPGSAASADAENKPDDDSSAESDRTPGSDASAGTEDTDDVTSAAGENLPGSVLSDGKPDVSGSSSADEPTAVPRPVGALLNTGVQKDRVTYSEGFYYEPLSDNLRRYITGISYPFLHTDDDVSAGSNKEKDANGQFEDSDSDVRTGKGGAQPEITLEELRYVHIWHYGFDGVPREGELICNEYIAQDLVEIFYELYRCEYRLEKVLLIDEYDGDDMSSMTDNNTSCFNYRQIAGSTSLSKHAYGLAVDVNPLYNPQITYEKDGTEVITPAAASAYADRSVGFAYKIDENDLCCRLFLQHGFTWGGNWNATKDYQHFQKAKP